MNRERLALAAGVALVVLAVVAFAGLAGFSLLGGDGDAGEFPTANGSPDGGSGGAGGDGTDGSSPPPFALDIGSVEECGATCREVTATLANNQDRRATGVTVHTRIYAGNGTGGDVVWEGEHAVGTLYAGTTETHTRRVELGRSGSIAVRREGGWVTILLSVETDRRTVRFVERRDVG